MEEFPGYLLPLPNFIKWANSGTKRKNFEYNIVPAVNYCLFLKDVSIEELQKSINEELMTVTSEGETHQVVGIPRSGLRFGTTLRVEAEILESQQLGMLDLHEESTSTASTDPPLVLESVV